MMETWVFMNWIIKFFLFVFFHLHTIYDFFFSFTQIQRGCFKPCGREGCFPIYRINNGEWLIRSWEGLSLEPPQVHSREKICVRGCNIKFLCQPTREPQVPVSIPAQVGAVVLKPLEKICLAANRKARKWGGGMIFTLKISFNGFKGPFLEIAFTPDLMLFHISLFEIFWIFVVLWFRSGQESQKLFSTIKKDLYLRVENSWYVLLIQGVVAT